MCGSDDYLLEKSKGELKIKNDNMGQSFQTVTKNGFIIEGEEDDDIEKVLLEKDIPVPIHSR